MKNVFDLTGKGAIVTGGNGGIGLGIAESLAQAGANVAIWARDQKKTDEAYNKLRQYGTTIVPLPCNVSDEEDIRECFSLTYDILHRIDFCVANAGITDWSTNFDEIDIETWRKIFKVNMEGAFLTFKHAVKFMIKHGGGSLLGISSGATVFGFPRAEHYAASKAGVIGMIQSIAVEYARYGIRANAVIPGWIQTDMTQPLIDNEKFVEKNLKRIPMRRWGQPSDIGALAVYLASDASSYHTGDTITVDGAYRHF